MITTPLRLSLAAFAMCFALIGHAQGLVSGSAGDTDEGLKAGPQVVDLVLELQEDNEQWALSRAGLKEHVRMRAASYGVTVHDTEGGTSESEVALLVIVNLVDAAFSLDVSFLRDAGYLCGSKKEKKVCWVLAPTWTRGSLGTSPSKSGGLVLSGLDDILTDFFKAYSNENGFRGAANGR